MGKGRGGGNEPDPRKNLLAQACLGLVAIPGTQQQRRGFAVGQRLPENPAESTASAVRTIVTPPVNPKNSPSPATVAVDRCNQADNVRLQIGARLADIVRLDMRATTLSKHPELLAMLPPTLAEMAGVIAHDAVLKIADRFGGSRIYIPLTPDAHGELAQLVGLANAKCLSQRYGKESIYVPRAGALRRVVRNEEVVRLSKSGLTTSQIAKIVNTTPRHLRRILHAGRSVPFSTNGARAKRDRRIETVSGSFRV